ncbi:GpU protein [Chitinophaga skermanii]|uniref:GpU protein n=1 Tax=Chitinophaga skermanii TaxID=331697 RepID=A0A327Q841_9BACT|nr:phage tail protein [Chitinophaga skermanii]RAJ00471.1 GpU protein [Chitinophaga skermanii]
MILQLGELEFSNAFTIQDYSENFKASITEHAVLKGKPKVQAGEGVLDEKNFTIRLHASFCTPKQILDTLIQYKNTVRILSLLNGHGDNLGTYIITDITNQVEALTPRGELLSCTVTISLKEFQREPMEQEKAKSKQQAKAVPGKTPLSNKRKANNPSCASDVNSTVSSMHANCNELDKIVTYNGGIYIIANHPTIQSRLEDIDQDAANLIRLYDSGNHCTSSYPQVKSSCNEIKAVVMQYMRNFRSNTTSLTTDQNKLNMAMRKLRTACQPLINASILRK